MNEIEKKFALDLAQKSLLFYLKNGVELVLEPEDELFNFGGDSEFFLPLGAFVTLKKDHHLRGCIGTIISDIELYKNIAQNAVSAGVKDPRFPPITLDEFPLLSWEISVIGPVERVSNMEDIVVGKHGLIMRNGHRQGLLLPQVPVEWKWDRKTFIEQTCLKANLSKEAYLDSETEIYWFTAEVFD